MLQGNGNFKIIMSVIYAILRQFCFAMWINLMLIKFIGDVLQYFNFIVLFDLCSSIWIRLGWEIVQIRSCFCIYWIGFNLCMRFSMMFYWISFSYSSICLDYFLLIFVPYSWFLFEFVFISLESWVNYIIHKQCVGHVRDVLVYRWIVGVWLWSKMGRQ